MRKLLAVLLLAFASSLFVSVPTVEAKPVAIHKAHKKQVHKKVKKRHHHARHHRHHRAAAVA